MKSTNSSIHSRRNFLFKAFSSCTVCCFAASNVLGSNMAPIQPGEKHKFYSDSGKSVQQVYNHAFTQWYIPAMNNLMKQIGKKKFVKMLKKSSDMLQHVEGSRKIDYSRRTLKLWSTKIKKNCENMSNLVTYHIVTDNDKLFEMKFTECIWATTFRKADASEIGYAGVCYQDYGMAKAYNPKMKLTRQITQMQGDDCCHFKWTMEA